MTQYDDPIADNAAIELNGEINAGELIYLGLDEIAYIKPIVEDGEDIYGIFAADGEQIGMAPEFELARAMTIQSDLYPVNVH
jgi:hypothetical protein